MAQALSTLSPVPLAGSALEALHHHYEELRRWSGGLNLIGPGTADEVLARHYGESLAALPLLRDTDRELVDVGSGGGFPGLVLAAAAPRLRVTLVEARQRKWAFLAAAARKARLPCRCLNARVDVPLPAGLPASIDVVTARALRLTPEVLDALSRRLAPDGRFLLWVGEETPELPAGLLPARSVPLAGSERRRILELVPSDAEHVAR